jgi:hypothetical protein
MRRSIITLTLVGSLVSGCRGPIVDLMEPTPVPPARPTEPGPSGSLPVAEIAALFQQAIDGSNAALAAAEERYADRSALNEHLAYFAALADAEATFLEAIQAIPWSEELREDANRLIQASTTYETRLRFASEVRSMGSLSAASRRAARASEEVAAATAILRDALGLPRPS